MVNDKKLTFINNPINFYLKTVILTPIDDI